MKKYKHKLLTLLSVLAIGATATGLSFTGSLNAKAEEKTYLPSSVFSASSASELTTGKVSDKDYMTMTFSEGSEVSYKQDLAYRWFSGKESEEFFSLEFAFLDKEFNEFTVSFESEENNKTKDDKAKNKVVFEKEGDRIYVKVNEEIGIPFENTTVKIEFTKDEECLSGDYKVLVNGSEIGKFENIGGYFAEYSATKVTPLTFKADLDEEKKTSVALISLNGQSFELNESGRITDNAAPVLVVNQELKSFKLGYTFSLDYEVVDVLDTTVTKTMEIYQYNPADSEVKYSELTTNKPLFELSGVEKNYVSIRYTLTDDDTDHKTEYYLSWFADKESVATIGEVDYIPLITDDVSPVYTCIGEREGEHGYMENYLDEENEAYKKYVEQVAEAAKLTKAGKGNYFYLPTLTDLVSDNDTAYTSMYFDIYYQLQTSSSSNSSTNKKSSDLSIQVTTAGLYSFRVVPSDTSGNRLELYQDGRKVKVTSSNVWDFDCIPEFKFKVYNEGVTIENAENSESGYVNSKYTFESFDIKGIEGYEEKYTLFYFEGAYGNNDFSYNKLLLMANSEKTREEPYGEFAKYFSKTEGSDLYLRKISIYDSTLDEDSDKWATSDNDYEWQGKGKTFVPQQEGYYVLMVEVNDGIYPTVAGFQVVEVQSERDYLDGETYWLQENIVPVILFSIAGVLVIVVILMLVIKPKSENIDEIDLDSLDENGAVVKGKKAKKEKIKKSKKDSEDID